MEELRLGLIHQGNQWIRVYQLGQKTLLMLSMLDQVGERYLVQLKERHKLRVLGSKFSAILIFHSN